MHMFVFSLLIIQKISCIIIFLLSALSLWSSQRALEYVHNKDVTLCFDRANQVRSS